MYVRLFTNIVLQILRVPRFQCFHFVIFIYIYFWIDLRVCSLDSTMHTHMWIIVCLSPYEFIYEGNGRKLPLVMMSLSLGCTYGCYIILVILIGTRQWHWIVQGTSVVQKVCGCVPILGPSYPIIFLYGVSNTSIG